MREGALPPGSFDEMFEAIRKELFRFLPGRNGDPQAGMAAAIKTLAMRMHEERDFSQRMAASHGRLEDAARVWAFDQMVQVLYYALVENHVIKPRRPLVLVYADAGTPTCGVPSSKSKRAMHCEFLPDHAEDFHCGRNRVGAWRSWPIGSVTA